MPATGKDVILFTFEYRFYPLQFDDDFMNAFDDNMRWFLSTLITNGLVLHTWQNTVKYDKYYACRLTAPEVDSLDKSYYNKNILESYKALVEKSSRPPVFIYIGENYNEMESCDCESPSHYVLLTEQKSSASPILCGDCLSPVPLYAFPKTDDEHDIDYIDILLWQDLYQACELQFISGIGERHGYEMIHSAASALTKEGRRICRVLEEKTGKPFYYFIYDYYAKNKPVCPICGESWVNEDLDQFDYDYVCHTCRLVSDKPIDKR
jgi:predicted  nucleic acid-binding Zn ribbon protein